MKHKNTLRHILAIAVCMAIALAALAPQTASTASYKKSVSKTVTVDAEKGEGCLTVKTKKAAKVTLTAKVTKGEFDNFVIMHPSNCPCALDGDGHNYLEMEFLEDGTKATVTLDLSKGSHRISFIPYEGSEDIKLKVTVKAKKAVLGTLKWKQ